MKLTLESKLDYITIESVYMKTFHEKDGYEFEYLKYPSYNARKTQNPKEKLYELSSDKKYDVEHIRIQKYSIEEFVKRKLDGYQDEIKLGEHYIFGYIAKYYPRLIVAPKFNQKFQLTCKKAEFIEEIEETSNIQKPDILMSLFELDRK
ncbi:MAG TPA: hypothetical protein ENN45_04400 [Bacteroidetes bacterium]|nr:hypothetical protein [Bacteroidota bacterium]